ncbi:hypothetical protein SZ64_12505 [Erythrobacter sp. SG61-1L]|nr:hypothetical protein SZ64_12505 [Erythrobacter sp. SG61-1L]
MFAGIGYVHILYFGLFALGVFSLFWARGRPIYVCFLAVALLALPLQAYLVRHGLLHCDGP